MIPRILSIVAPLFVYVSLVLVAWGLYRSRQQFEWLALVPALVGLLASFAFLQAEHRLFYDEDIYIHLASNLARAPVAQMTLLGGPQEIQVSSYYKEPVGWPVLLSLAFLLTGPSETVAFFLARLMYAAAIAAVYQLGRQLLSTRTQALAAAVGFGAAPACFLFSVSPGTDVPAALFGMLGLWGLVAGNGMLAAAALALAAQTRLELIVLVPLLLLPRSISLRWKITGIALVVSEFLHLQWVLSIAPVLAKVENADAAFSLRYLPKNFVANIQYVFNPLAFPAVLTVFALFGLHRNRTNENNPRLPIWVLAGPVAVLCVYMVFYAGSFKMNPRYAIQLIGPLAVMAAASLRWPILLVTLILPYIQPLQPTGYPLDLARDHQTALVYASKLGSTDLIVTTEPEVFFNQGLHAMNGIYASEREDKLSEQFGKYKKVWYYAGIRTNLENSQEWNADRWVKSHYELHLIDSQEIRGMRISFYEMLSKQIHREARLRGPLKS